MNENEKKYQDEKRGYNLDSYHPFWSLFNDAFSDYQSSDVLKTDVSEDAGGYSFEVEVPGINKNDIRISLDNGYLTIAASVKRNHEGKGKYIRTERYEGDFQRSFYVGEGVKKSDVKASVHDGVMTIHVDRPQKEPVEDKYIQIQ